MVGKRLVAVCENWQHRQNPRLGSGGNSETVHGSEGEKVSRAGPPGNGRGSTTTVEPLKLSRGDSMSPSLAAVNGNLEPGTRLIPLTQGRFAFVDSSEPFSDPRIAGYLQFLARELSEDGVRVFLSILRRLPV